MRRPLIACGLLTVLIAGYAVTADDEIQLVANKATVVKEWSQFRGPNRDNLSSETGLLTEWPEGGPKLLWSAKGIGKGYSTVSVREGVIYTMGNLGDDEMIIALDEKSGDILWSTRNGEAYHQGRGDGPRGTPTLDGKMLYALGGSGNLACVDLETHDVVWRRNILEDYDASNIRWGISESVLIDGDRLICTPGGSVATIVALDKHTGKEIWKSLVEGEDRAGYSSAVVATIGDVRQYIQFTGRGTVGIRAEDGKYMWRNNRSANGTANCSSPLISDGHVFTASGYGTGGALVKLIPGADSTEAEFVYHTAKMKNHHGGMVLVDGYIYGTNNATLTCLDFLTGEVQWEDRSVGKGAVTYADGHIYLRSEDGPIALVEANPKEYVERGRFEQPERSDEKAWAHPVIAGGKLYLRDMDVLLCYDLRK